MARVAVVGGGYAGLAAAARLAKHGHEVTLFERADELGGALRSVAGDGWRWDGAAHITLLPAAMRDLFRKSGRPLEAELRLEPVEVLREHRWPDGSLLRLPGGSRRRQHEAAEALGSGLGQAWLAHVASYAPVWDVLRRGYLEPAWDAAAPGPARDLDRAVAGLLDARESLHRRLGRSLGRSRGGRQLADVAAYPLLAAGHDVRSVPAWAGVTAFLEQCFGGWRVVGGSQQLSEALASRLLSRGAAVELGVDVGDVVVRAGRTLGVRTAHGTADADAVVCAVDPARLPALAPHVRRTQPATLPHLTHLGLAADPSAGTDRPADAEHELVLHDGPTLAVWPGVLAPSGGRACTVLSRARTGEDVLAALARRGLDLRERVLVRVDRAPSSMLAQWGGSPLGVRWQGPRTARRRLGPRTPVAGVYAAGAHAAPGAGLPFVALSAARAVEALEHDLDR